MNFKNPLLLLTRNERSRHNFTGAAETPLAFLRISQQAMVLEVGLQISSYIGSAKGLRTNFTPLYAFVVLVGFFHDVLSHIEGADAAFDRTA